MYLTLTFLYLFPCGCCSDTVHLLLKCGASTKISDNSGSPPLHLAAWKGDLDIVKMLVTQGPSYANVNQQNDGDDSALHLASQYGYAPVVEFLLQVCLCVRVHESMFVCACVRVTHRAQ